VLLSICGLKWGFSGWQIASTLLPNSLVHKIFLYTRESPLVSLAPVAQNDKKTGLQATSQGGNEYLRGQSHGGGHGG
jgi:hypothetical protein